MLKPCVKFTCEKCGAPATEVVERDLSLLNEIASGTERNEKIVRQALADVLYEISIGSTPVLCENCEPAELRRLLYAPDHDFTILKGGKDEPPEGYQAVKVRWYSCSECGAYVHIPDDDKRQICPMCDVGVLVFDKYVWMDRSMYEEDMRECARLRMRDQLRIVRKEGE